MDHDEQRAQLPNGRDAIIRKPEIARDLDNLVGFYKALPPEIKNYLRYEADNPALCRKRLEQIDDKNHWRAIAEIDGKIVGDATMDREPFGWTRHMAELRNVVDPKFQGCGVGLMLFNHLVELVRDARVERVFIEVLKRHQPVIRTLEKRGFVCDGILKQRARDLKGELHDVVFMSNDLEKVWRGLAEHLCDMDIQVYRIHGGE